MMELEGLAISPNESRVYLFVKRLMDIVLSLLGLIVLSPLFAVVACLIYMEDAGKIIFCQDRNGKGIIFFACTNSEACERMPHCFAREWKNSMSWMVRHLR